MEATQLDYASLRRQPRNFHRISVTDPALMSDQNPKGELWFELRRLLTTEEDASRNDADDYIRKYVTGGFSFPSGEWCAEPLMYPIIDGESPTLTAESLYEFFAIAKMAKGISADDLIHLSQTLESAWSQLRAKAKMVQYGVFDQKKAITEPEVQTLQS